jgi:UTP-glucose-1-phosphate uridylyltransferase
MQLVSDEAVTHYSSLLLEQVRDRVMRVVDVNEKPTPEENSPTTRSWAGTFYSGISTSLKI